MDTMAGTKVAERKFYQCRVSIKRAINFTRGCKLKLLRPKEIRKFPVENYRGDRKNAASKHGLGVRERRKQANKDTGMQAA